MKRAVQYWHTFEGFLRRLKNMDVKKAIGIFVVLYVIYYGVEGFGRTVFSDFTIPAELAQELIGVDGQTLSQQLLIEIQSIQRLQNSAATIDTNLLKGLKAVHVQGDPLQVRLSVRLNTDYRSIVRDVGKFEWGPFEIPAAVLLHPFQKFIRQTVVQLSLQRAGGIYRVLASADSGAVWESAIPVPDTDQAGRSTETDVISDLIRATAFKIAYIDGNAYQPSENISAYQQFHQGVLLLVDYFKMQNVESEHAIAMLSKSAGCFREALTQNKMDEKSLQNLFVAEFERSSYLKNEEKIRAYEHLLVELKRLNSAEPPDVALGTFFVATYAMLGQTYFDAEDYAESSNAYENALRIMGENRMLRAYIHNNLGLAYERADRKEEALRNYQRALTYNSSYARAHLNLGHLFISMQDFGSAEQEFADSIRKRPTYLHGYYNMGFLYLQLTSRGALKALGEDTARCVRDEAIGGLRTYLTLLESRELTQALSHEETLRREIARQWLGAFGGDSVTGEEDDRPIRYGMCLSR